MWQSTKDLESEIELYQNRIEASRQKIKALLPGYIAFKDHKKRETKRREYLADIKHIKQLIKYAEEAINNEIL